MNVLYILLQFGSNDIICTYEYFATLNAVMF